MASFKAQLLSLSPSSVAKERFRELKRRADVCGYSLPNREDGVSEAEYKKHMDKIHTCMFSRLKKRKKQMANLEEACRLIKVHKLDLKVSPGMEVTNEELQGIKDYVSERCMEVTNEELQGIKDYVSERCMDTNLEKAMALDKQHNLGIDFAAISYKVSDSDLANILDYVSTKRSSPKPDSTKKSRPGATYTLADMFGKCDDSVLDDCLKIYGLDRVSEKETNVKTLVDFVESDTSKLTLLKSATLKHICSKNGVSKSGKNKAEHVQNLHNGLCLS
jgi:hypothetical protein